MKNNPDSSLEQELFISDSQEMLDTRTDVSLRLGYAEDDILSYEEVYAIFDACRLDRARRPNTPSPWCAAFQDEQLAVRQTI